MKYLPITLIITLSASLFVGLVFNPVIASSFLKLDEKMSRLPGARLLRWLIVRYEATLQWTLRHRGLSLGGMVAGFIAMLFLYGAANQNDQAFGRYDQDFRFGAINLKSAFFLVKLLEDHGYEGSRHFDAHAYRSEDYEGVKDFARGCMRTYLILKEKAARWNADAEIQSLLAEINSGDASMDQYAGPYSPQKGKALKAQSFDRVALSARGLKYERLDQLTVELLLGIR